MIKTIEIVIAISELYFGLWIYTTAKYSYGEGYNEGYETCIRDYNKRERKEV